MFNLLTDAIGNALSVVGGVVKGKMPTQRQVAQMLADGMTLASIASAAGVAVEVVERILEGKGDS